MNAAVVAEIEARGRRGLAVQADITAPDDVQRLVDEVTSELGGIDVLVNNAGVAIHRPALEVPPEEWQQVLDLNLTALWHCRTAVAPGMIESGGGVIVNVGSMSGQIANRPQWQASYNASKAAVHQLTRSLAYATSEEIAPTVVYLARPASTFMTGSLILIDGGYSVF